MEIHYIKIDGVEYPACFSMAATEDITREFGGVKEMSAGLMDYDVSVVGKMLHILISAGIEYCDMKGVEHPELPKGRLTALMSVKETQELVSKIFDVMTEDAKRDVEVSSKN